MHPCDVCPAKQLCEKNHFKENLSLYFRLPELTELLSGSRLQTRHAKKTNVIPAITNIHFLNNEVELNIDNFFYLDGLDKSLMRYSRL